MTATGATTGKSPRRGWFWPLALALVVVVGVAWLVRSALWPCGMLDRQSGCVSSVALDVASVDHVRTATRVELRSFDLSAGAGLALVGLAGRNGEENWQATVALFDTRTGAVARILHQAVKAPQSSVEPAVRQVALSPDGRLAAALVVAADDDQPVSSLVVYDIETGGVLTTLDQAKGPEAIDGTDCTGMLDFSADSRFLQCAYRLFSLADGSHTLLVDPDDPTRETYLYPMPAEFLGERAPDGTKRSDLDLIGGLTFPRVFDRFTFAPDSKGLLQVNSIYRTGPGQRLRPYLIGHFWPLSAVNVWDAKAERLERSFYSDQDYDAYSWSRDSAHFGLITDDLRLDVFER